MLLFLLHIFWAVLFIYLSVSSVYMLFMVAGGRLRKAPVYSSDPDKKRIAVIIPSYKEDNIIIDTASKAIRQDYPNAYFDVFIVADKLQKETIEKLKALPLTVVEVQFEVSMKAKSMHAAFESIPVDKYDIAMILDADNVMSAGCLEKVNHAFHKGFQAVQCHRVAKNKNNAVAVLDAISEEINNQLFRIGQRAFGLSSALIGSGMAFEFEKLKAIFSSTHILNNAGEDREIDLQLMKDKVIIEFIRDALVYDEKVSSPMVFEKQRTRWLEAQVNNCKRFFDEDMRSLSNRKIYWYKLFQTLLLPRSLYLLVFAILMTLISAGYLLHFPLLFPAGPWWVLVLIIYLASLIFAIPAVYFNIDTLKAVVHLPVLILSMVKALFKMKSNRKEFLHTPKLHTGEP
jgi:cellulose synthase/poly-beta-1,6-N-acetylglucosamine synthase-like glycosyltransferase